MNAKNHFFKKIEETIWLEYDFYKYLEKECFLDLSYSELYKLVKIWNRAIEKTYSYNE